MDKDGKISLEDFRGMLESSRAAPVTDDVLGGHSA
jgi:hypothetical protein